MLKSALRSSLGSFIISLHLAAVMMVLVGLQRWHQRGREALKLRIKTQPQIIIFWHEYLFVMSPLLPGGCSASAIPASRWKGAGGRLAAVWVAPCLGQQQPQGGIGPAPAGNRDKIRAFSCDNPGRATRPARTLSMGPVSLAQLTGAPITLVAWSAAIMAGK